MTKPRPRTSGLLQHERKRYALDDPELLEFAKETGTQAVIDRATGLARSTLHAEGRVDHFGWFGVTLDGEIVEYPTKEAARPDLHKLARLTLRPDLDTEAASPVSAVGKALEVLEAARFLAEARARGSIEDAIEWAMRLGIAATMLNVVSARWPELADTGARARQGSRKGNASAARQLPDWHATAQRLGEEYRERHPEASKRTIAKNITASVGKSTESIRKILGKPAGG